MVTREMMNNITRLLKQKGYVCTKNEQGYFYDDGTRKFSIMQTGQIYNCFFNKKDEGGIWTLQAKSEVKLHYGDCLLWVLQFLQKDI